MTKLAKGRANKAIARQPRTSDIQQHLIRGLVVRRVGFVRQWHRAIRVDKRIAYPSALARTLDGTGNRIEMPLPGGMQ